MMALALMSLLLYFSALVSVHSLHLSRATSADHAQIARLCVDVFYGEDALKHSELEADFDEDREMAFCLRHLRSQDAKKVSHFVVRGEEDTSAASGASAAVVGFAEVVLTNEHNRILQKAGLSYRKERPKVHSLVIDSRFRRKGLGTQLMAACLAQARQVWKCDELFLEIREDNIQGVFFYSNLGFRVLEGAKELLKSKHPLDYEAGKACEIMVFTSAL